MVSAVTVVLVALPCIWLYAQYAALQKNIVAAKHSGLPYVVVPVNIYNRLWLITNPLWFPLLRMLPEAWTRNRLNLMHPHWCFIDLYEPYAKLGDTFLTVSPGLVIVWVSNAEAIVQITQRRESFPKPLASYKILNIYGRSLLTSEGLDWKQHRKVSAPSFNEKNNLLVFKEAIASTQGMLRKWMAAKNTTLNDTALDSMRVTLHIICMIGFGVRLFWPGEGPNDALALGHTMGFEESLTALLDNLLWVLLLPTWLLKRTPVKAAKKAYESFVNWGNYMKEIMAEKIADSRAGERGEGMDIMGVLVKSAYGDGKPKSKDPEQGNSGKTVLSDSDILGNAFVMIIAGHETTANVVYFSLTELAINIGSQRRLQKEIEAMFGSTSPETWDYDSTINALLGSMVGAVMNEVLRIMPPVINIPKSVRQDADQSIVIDGKKIILPKGAHINLNTIGIHRSPKYWPSHGPSKVDDSPDDLNDFIPERWLVSEEARFKANGDDTPDVLEKDEFGGFTGRDSSAQLFRPARGSYLPFSDGSRSCLGRRLAQVEVMAVLAVIFQNYSIELAVDEWASDAEVEKMSVQDKRTLYNKAMTKARAIIRCATTRITLKLHEGDGFIPVRVVKKGEERFFGIVDV